MDESERGQVSLSAAEVYEQFFVPALFQEWAGKVAGAAGVQPGDRALDVACGTGVLACTLLDRVGPGGSVTGLDANEGMLSVAKQKAPEVEWKQGRAEAMPFESGSFDTVASQFGLMFFEDQEAAIREMRRVLRPSGGMAVAVWDKLENTPGYAAMVALLQRLFGERVADMLRAPFSLGDRQGLQGLFARAGIPEVEILTYTGTARFPSVQDWVHTDIKGWTLAEALDEEHYSRLQREAKTALAKFVQADGSVAFDIPAHIARLPRTSRTTS
jgi:ubiquinone/menaquinone biosynthesis C-methylase UbiE